MYCAVNECVLGMSVWSAFVNISEYWCMSGCVCVSTAGRGGGSTAGRRCALKSASPPGTG